jgi:hypothetical protein
VLTFLSPIFTGIAGALLLKEPLSRKELLAGCKPLFHRPSTLLFRIHYHFILTYNVYTVCSFAGVVLIARPEFLFGHVAHAAASAEKGTPAQRLVAVGCVPAWRVSRTAC